MTTPSNRVPGLPHAAPFLLIDRVLDVEERRGRFLKLVTAADPCTAPDGTLPAAFILEALAQAGAALLTGLGAAGVEPGYLAAVDGFRVVAPVRVGDELHLEVELIRILGPASSLRGQALVDGRLCAEGRFTLALPR